MFHNLPITTPEIRCYVLSDEYGHVNVIVTDDDLKRSFSEDEIRKLKSNRHNYYNLTEVFD